MKKVIAAFAAAAVAVSMFAFAGCGDKTDPGAVKGDYKEKTAAEMVEILNGVDAAKIMNLGEKNVGLTVDLSGGFAMGELMSGNGSVKMNVTADVSDIDNVKAYGTAQVNAEYKVPGEEGTVENKMALNATAYVVENVAYGAVTGLAENEMKAKVNLAELFGAERNEDYYSPVKALVEAAPSEETEAMTQTLTMLSQLGVKFYADTTSGVKVKVSATADTVWGALDMVAAGDEEFAETVTMVKENVTLNKFQFDVYFALDGEGVFSQASVVCDVDVTVKGTLLSALMETEGMPDLTAHVKGSVALATTTTKVNVPENLATDETYYDATEALLEMLADMF